MVIYWKLCEDVCLERYYKHAKNASVTFQQIYVLLKWKFTVEEVLKKEFTHFLVFLKPICLSFIKHERRYCAENQSCISLE